MVLWSFWAASLTNPGNVPLKWGYDYNGMDVVKRRFCLTCQCFKPDRCHHCSACNVCVLNMDHHCLWINNCIGFWNRKKFLLLIMYAEIITIFIEVTLTRDLFEALKWGFSDQFFSKFDNTFKQHMLVIITYFFNTIILTLMTFFLRFHWRLAVENKTTIENLEHCDQRFWSKYDVGRDKNLAQIFGSNPFLYALPIAGEPHGDGLRFPIRKNFIHAISSHDVENSRRQ
jgi:palmitoyltransferase